MADTNDLDAELKAILSSDLSDGAKIAAIAELLGCRGADEIAKAVNKKVRTVERHYAELRKCQPLRKSADTQMCGTQNCGNPQICVEKPAELRSDATQICVVESHTPADITTRPTKELPSEVVILNNNPPLQTPTPKTKRQTGTRGSRLPDDWELPEDWRQWTLCNCPVSTPETVAREALIFANYWQSLAGQKATKTDWRKTWQNWTMRTFGSGPARLPRAQAPSWQEERNRKARLIMELASQPREIDFVQ
jgi:hypothetical protein